MSVCEKCGGLVPGSTDEGGRGWCKCERIDLLALSAGLMETRDEPAPTETDRRNTAELARHRMPKPYGDKLAWPTVGELIVGYVSTTGKSIMGCYKHPNRTSGVRILIMRPTGLVL